VGFVELHAKASPAASVPDIAHAPLARIKISVHQWKPARAPEVERLLDAGFEKIVVSMDSADLERFQPSDRFGDA
jgi:hypothetical protein